MKKKPEINKDLMKKEYIEARRLAINEASRNLIKYMQYVTVDDNGLLTYHTGFPEVLDIYLRTLSMCQLAEEMPHIDSMEFCKHYQYEEGKKV